ncbi:MAG: phosphoribosylformylglycinamidine cyclo-ligase [Candidatus Altiarchaeota archaeon]|nr:phosphoribosylformylglycinamidine cyclo-ligase [Candidatus Altiarchaeota archaeon]
MTYSKAGVSIEREELAIRSMINILQRTFKFRKGKQGEVLEDIGTFANVIDLGDQALAMCTDGVGSKVLVAQELGRYNTIGVDVVAMNVNDLICIGARPLAMVDYLAVSRINPDIMKEIAIGIYEGAKQSDIAIIGGETATLPDIIMGVDGKGFDIAGTAIGLVDKDKIITGEKINSGDVVLGFRSSGIHSNGLTLARRVLPRNMWMELLTPTRIYVKEVIELLGNYEVHGLAHITGGGFRNLLRITPLGFLLDSLPAPQMIFKKIQELGNVSDKEMYKTFNMGVGFCVILDGSSADEIIKKYGNKWKISRIGSITGDGGVKIVKEGGEIIFQ